uniref:Uncharacterized protein n=1 Tax=Rhizophora mucronata TaxID=61149 RepID=A0A2P2PJP1_RHIMU
MGKNLRGKTIKQGNIIRHKKLIPTFLVKSAPFLSSRSSV